MGRYVLVSQLHRRPFDAGTGLHRTEFGLFVHLKRVIYLGVDHLPRLLSTTGGFLAVLLGAAFPADGGRAENRLVDAVRAELPGRFGSLSFCGTGQIVSIPGRDGEGGARMLVSFSEVGWTTEDYSTVSQSSLLEEDTNTTSSSRRLDYVQHDFTFTTVSDVDTAPH